MKSDYKKKKIGKFLPGKITLSKMKGQIIKGEKHCILNQSQRTNFLYLKKNAINRKEKYESNDLSRVHIKRNIDGT